MNHVTVIGAGLAGSECAWQLAQRGIPGDAAGDEAGENDPCPPDRRFCGAVLLQFPARRRGWRTLWAF